jgi:hypothetical protein
MAILIPAASLRVGYSGDQRIQILNFIIAGIFIENAILRWEDVPTDMNEDFACFAFRAMGGGRVIWTAKVQREGWLPTNASYLCV